MYSCIREDCIVLQVSAIIGSRLRARYPLHLRWIHKAARQTSAPARAGSTSGTTFFSCWNSNKCPEKTNHNQTNKKSPFSESQPEFFPLTRYNYSLYDVFAMPASEYYATFLQTFRWNPHHYESSELNTKKNSENSYKATCYEIFKYLSIYRVS